MRLNKPRHQASQYDSAKLPLGVCMLLCQNVKRSAGPAVRRCHFPASKKQLKKSASHCHLLGVRFYAQLRLVSA
jgi:hypothetical protein